MKFSVFDFECIWQQDTTVHQFPGSMLRGSLGNALKSIICTIRNTGCDDCLLNNQCLYSRIFENKKVQNGFLNQSGLPHPYVIEWDKDCTGEFHEGDAFRFSLILFGQYIDTLPYFIYAVERMGEKGLGRKNESGERSTLELSRVLFDEEVIYRKEEKSLPDEIPKHTLSVGNPNDSLHGVGQLKIKLVTPLRIKEKGRYTRGIDFQMFVRAVTRRLEAISKCYGEVPLYIDKNEVMPLARTIKTKDSNLQWQIQKRFSNRQSTRMNLDGIIGDITFEGELTPLMSLISAVEPLHIGKATSFGLGKYEICKT